MNATRLITAAALIAGATLALPPALAQFTGLQRTDLIKRDLRIAGRETVQTRVDFAPGTVAPAHAHPGEKIAYVLEGTLEYQIDGSAPDTAIRPFHVHVAQADLKDLKKRVNATRWPDMETVADSSQGVQLANLRDLVHYWGGGYDWRKAEARLNALPMYVTRIDGVDIQFIHVRSREANALPMIITHGWPGSILEMTKVIDPLTNPTAHAGKGEDAFDVVIPSIPGYGFSGKPQGKGWDPEHVARAWDVLMKRLGYQNYVAQGGDWGAPISSALARQAPQGLRGIHLNLPAVVPPEASAARVGRSVPIRR